MNKLSSINKGDIVYSKSSSYPCMRAVWVPVLFYTFILISCRFVLIIVKLAKRLNC